MFDFMYQLPDLYVFAMLSIFSIILSIIAIFMVKRYIPLYVRYKDDPVIGNISSLISIIYGVLVGITALYLINNISYTGDAVQRETNSVANIYRDSKWLNEPTQTHIQNSIKKYLIETINTDWPLMTSGKKVNPKGDTIIDEMSSELSIYKIASEGDKVIVPAMLDSIKNLYNARQQRIQMSYASLNPDLWIVILIGTILTICINYLFGMNFYLHIFTMTVAALMVSSMIFLLIALDRPFQGEFVIQPSGFQNILDSMNKLTKP